MGRVWVRPEGAFKAREEFAIKNRCWAHDCLSRFREILEGETSEQSWK
uniref:Uncharacterized protein LOC105127223 isoform X1 n=1 Tax=Rhizophora mucronata TaxID=61149 RepID=A0A2P2LHC2_RHIMU